ncbi:copper-transporting ATPase [Gallibacterium salpingitidis]|uniref:Copper-transporting ATPase n=1 Tax=Gallibacterium salpingitidis TaxID=505341 RepID=A0AB36E553_9PAST|nr:copper ion binding protein [Gallibacterium salpingitidis]OBX08620.1 copper-transporting ATPase [Gallibacterium salpingitidis]OBX08958.1 copper-transporting ATPase [Gallibacterium salpingitidis]WKS98814.1 copper ion binding protein [Gallibacterium salpingitidis]
MILLKLADLSCQHCVKSVTNALNSVAGVQQVKVSLHYAKVEGEASAEQLIQAVQQAGYQAEIATEPSQALSLSGLNCQHCINSVRNALENLTDVVYANVEKTVAKVYGDASTEALVQAVEQAGFSAK